ncbi:MAG TPA: metallophosphoesterase [Candidatus Acidoferrales bacterium]|nr:metallophosphoesterase [Candidatus Acidoferrales bacterium]
MRNLPELVVVCGALLCGCGSKSNGVAGQTSTLATGPAVPVSSITNGDPVLLAAGDIANCKMIEGAQATAKIIEKIPGTVAALGDLALSDGSAEEFANCYDKTWGAFKSRTRPAPGNHEFHSSSATPYFDYFGAAAGNPKKGYYSYELGSWHIIALNGECKHTGGCQGGSPEETWLAQDLQEHRAACTLAYWHEPLFSSGAGHGNDADYHRFWVDLYHANTTIVLNGHDHDYERFAPQDPDGKADPAHGIREFVVGTGGNHERAFSPEPQPNSEVRMTDIFGVLKLTLHPRGYDWEFIPQAGKTFHDAGTGICH